jgi:superfamily II RNA helicase
MEYKQFVLDDFQVKSIESLEKNHSVVVSAATGTGKTLIADYVINKYIKTGSKIIYTAPIKALSNQKYREFKEEYGDKIGLITGDIVINQTAQVLIMTTEIYRNMLVTQDEMINEISYVIFDEIHYINDFERGTVWEESIIFSPENIRFLCLSATIPNAQEFADWIISIKNHNVDVVTYSKRAVPLTHSLYHPQTGFVSIDEFEKIVKNGRYKDVFGNLSFDNGSKFKKGKFNKPKQNKLISKSHIDLVKELKNKKEVPCIFFVFSRRACEEKAKELKQALKENDFTTPEEKSEIIKCIRDNLDMQYAQLETVKLFRDVLPHGIAFHHAGLLPCLKFIVETLFNKGLIKTLYATETFAVGINMPAKTVCFSSLEKYDGYSFRYMKTKEYFQMAGRAGRRGIDKFGKSIALIDNHYNDPNKVVKLMSKDVESIKSQYKLSYNTILNLLNNYDESTIEVILKSSFDYFLRKKQNKNIRIMASFQNSVKRLQKMGFVDNDKKITEKGEFARYIYQHEILITELFDSEIMDGLTESEIVCLLSTIVYEPRKNDNFYKRSNQIYRQIYGKINDYVGMSYFARQKIDKLLLRKLIPITYSWANGAEFTEIMDMTNLAEGDVIRLFRQTVDFLRQILRATRSQKRIEKLQICMDRIYRDVIKPEF